MESIDLKVVTTWKWRVTFYLVGIFRTSSLGGSFSNNPERTPLRMQREEPGYVEVLQQRVGSLKFCNKRAGSLNVKRLLLIKGNQMFQVKEVRIFLCMGRRKSLGLLKSVLSYASQLSGASILYSHPEFLKPHGREWPQHDLAAILLSECPEGLELVISVTSLCIDMAGNTSFLKRAYLFIWFVVWGIQNSFPKSQPLQIHFFLKYHYLLCSWNIEQ